MIQQAISIIFLLRPHQWLKNIILFFPPFLGGALFSPAVLKQGILPFASLCAAASATYIVNDIRDCVQDRNHPVKRNRPIAKKDIPASVAWTFAGILLIISLFSAWQVSSTFFLLLILYMLISFLYSCCLKHIPIVDLFCISSGFLVRLQAGGEAFQLVISPWLFLSVFLLALFLSTGKRINEQLLLGVSAGEHRKTLALYPQGFLDGILFMTGGAVLVTYTIYVVQRPWLVYSVPLCCFGLLRYSYRVKTGKGGDPTESLLRDPWLFAVGLIWTLMMGWGVYGR